VRTYALLQLATATTSLILLCAACGQHRTDSDAGTVSPSPSPVPLQSCETRELNLDGADLVVQANADGSPASIIVVRAPNDDARAKALDAAHHAFGAPHRDGQMMQRTSKWGITTLADACGRPVSPAPLASPAK
jgi:hypothetical protein